MSQIESINNAPIGRVNAYAPVRASGERGGVETSPVGAESRTDTVDLSDRARFLEALRSNTIVRTELVDRVRAEIAAGTYDTPERFEQALDGLIEDLGG